MFTEIKEEASFHRTPKHLSTWQDMEGKGRSRRQWKTAEPTVHFLSPPKKNLLYSSTSSLLYSLSLSYNQVSQRYSLSPSPPHHSLADTNLSLFRDPSCPALLLLDWQNMKCTELTSFSTDHYTVFQLQTNLEWSGLNPRQKSRPAPKVKSHYWTWSMQTRQLPRRVSRKVFPDHVSTPTAPRKPWSSLLHHTALIFHFQVFPVHSCTIQSSICVL